MTAKCTCGEIYMRNCPIHQNEWIDDAEVQQLLKWVEQCTLAELILAKEFVEKYRGKNQ